MILSAFTEAGGDIVEDNGFGWQCTSDKIENFVRLVEHIANLDIDPRMKENGLKYLEENYTPKVGYKAILKHLNK